MLLTIFLLFVQIFPAAADIAVVKVSESQAKNLGLEISATVLKSGSVAVRLEFPTDTHFRDFGSVGLNIVDAKGEEVLSAALMRNERPGKRVMFAFTVGKAQVAHTKLIIWVAAGFGGDQYEIALKDFVSVKAGVEKAIDDKPESDAPLDAEKDAPDAPVEDAERAEPAAKDRSVGKDKD